MELLSYYGNISYHHRWTSPIFQNHAKEYILTFMQVNYFIHSFTTLKYHYVPHNTLARIF